MSAHACYTRVVTNAFATFIRQTNTIKKHAIDEAGEVGSMVHSSIDSATTARDVLIHLVS